MNKLYYSIGFHCVNIILLKHLCSALNQRCPTFKKHSPQTWRKELLCHHNFKYIDASVGEID